jgi:hypothetical protein
VALTDEQPSMDSTAAIRGAADVGGLAWPAGRTVENDPYVWPTALAAKESPTAGMEWITMSLQARNLAYYQRACDLIMRQASTGPFGSPVFASAGKTDPPSRLFLSQTSAGTVVFK